MLWFRSHADFDDWLNNPYHTQAQRNFLIKLAVNFVHDLYKPNVRGYQVTQARTKPYGKQLVRQFKLERWMDYGPTIAAAFGSSDPKEVDDLRQAIVECMRNTPVGDGIRATGAVRQDRPEHPNGGPGQQYVAQPPPQPTQPTERELVAMAESNRRNYISSSASVGYGQPPSSSIPHSGQSVMSTGDLLDDQRNFDDAGSVLTFGAAQSVPGNFNNPPSLLDFSQPAQTTQPTPAQPQYGQQQAVQQDPYQPPQPQYGQQPVQQDPYQQSQPQYGQQPVQQDQYQQSQQQYGQQPVQQDPYQQPPTHYGQQQAMFQQHTQAQNPF
eukprot:CAMPEP_0116559548 /NCGR_PEP_ID=MMETSP0397-20121206/10461_1 /TAXON_ID=216820 /ORGANISM="Cyclophora tenuis, Strain ECT3854" /LENGTH=324 /DNA_ID=CAMNT_0004085337 /DNA_START=140 /DNA_END=1114 /DNA_ORIENTATION=-